MKVVLDRVSKGRKGQALPETSLEFSSGTVHFALAETEQRPTVLGLIASGRMKPDTGRVTIDDTKDATQLRLRAALVDAPDVSDPHPGIALASVVGEELMFAGKPATPIHARRWLSSLGFADIAGAPIGTVDPFARVRILCELAVLREGVEGIVLVHPDRHGGNPDGWSRIAREFADRGYAMLVIVGGSAAVAIERMPDPHPLPSTRALADVAPEATTATPADSTPLHSAAAPSEQHTRGEAPTPEAGLAESPGEADAGGAEETSYPDEEATR